MPYNFAAESFHTKKLCSKLSSSEVHFLVMNLLLSCGCCQGKSKDERSRKSRDKNEDEVVREKTGDERHRSKDRHHDRSKENSDNKEAEKDQKQVKFARSLRQSIHQKLIIVRPTSN